MNDGKGLCEIVDEEKLRKSRVFGYFDAVNAWLRAKAWNPIAVLKLDEQYFVCGITRRECKLGKLENPGMLRGYARRIVKSDISDAFVEFLRYWRTVVPGIPTCESAFRIETAILGEVKGEDSNEN